MAFIAFNGLLPHECATSLRCHVDCESPYELWVHEWLMTHFDKISAWLTLHARWSTFAPFILFSSFPLFSLIALDSIVFAIHQSCKLTSNHKSLVVRVHRLSWISQFPCLTLFGCVPVVFHDTASKECKNKLAEAYELNKTRNGTVNEEDLKILRRKFEEKQSEEPKSKRLKNKSWMPKATT